MKLIFNKEKALENIKLYGTSLKEFPQFKNDMDVALKCIYVNFNNFQYVSNKLKNDKDFVLKALAINSGIVRFLPKKLLDDKDIAISALNNSDYADEFKFLSPRLQKDREIVNIAINKNGNLICAISDSLKDKDLKVAAIKSRGMAISSIPEFQDNKEMALIAVKQDGLAICYLSDRLKDDKDVVLAAASKFYGALGYASKRLQDDFDLVMAAVKNDGKSLQFASARLKDDIEIATMAMKKSPNEAYQFLSERLKEVKQFALQHIMASANNFKNISPKLKKDKEIIVEALYGSKNDYYHDTYYLLSKIENENVFRDAYLLGRRRIEELHDVCIDLKNFAKLSDFFFEDENSECLTFATELVCEKLGELPQTAENKEYKEKILQLMKETIYSKKDKLDNSNDKEENKGAEDMEKEVKRFIDEEVYYD